MDNIQGLKECLTPPVQRNMLAEIIAHGIILPAPARALAYVLLQNMTQAELDNLALVAISALEAAEGGDNEGLDKILLANKIPPQIIGVIKQYASHLAVE